MEALKFVPFSSSIHPGFWTELTKMKLEVILKHEIFFNVLQLGRRFERRTYRYNWHIHQL